jgi:hypothetical protein
MKIRLLALAAMSAPAVMFAAPSPQSVNPPPLFPTNPAYAPEQKVVIEELAPPLIIKGKYADELSDDEKKEFLQEKIKTIYQEDGQVELLRVAPGYPLTLSFEDSIGNVVVGDTSLVNVSNLNDRTLLLSALIREGDTTMQVFFPGNKLRIYHIFIADNFLTGETAIRVAAFGDAGPNGGATAQQTAGWLGNSKDKLDIRSITQIIRNYDALVQEGAVDSRMVKRFEIFRKSGITSFTTYYIYKFSSDPAVVTFAYENPFPYPIRYDESRLRLAIGNVRYVPDYVSIHKNVLAPGERTTGFAVLSHPAFRFDQPFELVWK